MCSDSRDVYGAEGGVFVVVDRCGWGWLYTLLSFRAFSLLASNALLALVWTKILQGRRRVVGRRRGRAIGDHVFPRVPFYHVDKSWLDYLHVPPHHVRERGELEVPPVRSCEKWANSCGGPRTAD